MGNQSKRNQISDIRPLVSLTNLIELDLSNTSRVTLDGSQTMKDIQALEDRGVDVTYDW